METFKLVKNDDGRYQQISDEKNEILDIISAVLEDGGIDFDFVFDWLHNTRFSTLYSNSCAFVKVGADKVVVTSQQLSSGAMSPYFEVSTSKLLDLIDQWKKIYEEKPDEIVVSNLGGDIHLEYTY
ncbi:hypothetical protein HN446_02670 [bacterium]|jgi:hypothetical protein|nr:hypothetical protein [bacterium]